MPYDSVVLLLGVCDFQLGSAIIFTTLPRGLSRRTAVSARVLSFPVQRADHLLLSRYAAFALLSVFDGRSGTIGPK